MFKSNMIKFEPMRRKTQWKKMVNREPNEKSKGNYTLKYKNYRTMVV